MVLSKIVVQLQRLRQFCSENAREHKRLIKLLDFVQREGAQNPPQSPPSAISLDLQVFEELSTLATHFYERDQVVKDSVERCVQTCHAVRPEALRRLKDKMRVVRKELGRVKDQLGRENAEMAKTTKRIAMVVEEFRSRCRETYTEYLKNLDLDLRKILKPLVPSKVLDEQIKYRKINSNPSIQSSLQSTLKSELREGHDGPDLEQSSDYDPEADQSSKLNAHIELLVNTLETVAKELIAVCGDVNRRYYEVVDPAELVSGPPTPLAAPLPEYFSFKAADYIEDQLELMNIVDPAVISESQRQILVQKLMKLNQEGQFCDHLRQPEKAEKLKRKLECMGKLKEDIRQLNLEEVFRDESAIPVSERERLVYSLINSERQGKDVTLDEIINAPQGSEGDSMQLVAHPREARRQKAKAKKKVEETEESGLPPPVDNSQKESHHKADLAPPPLADNSFDEFAGREKQVDVQRSYAGNYYTPPADALRTPQGFFEQHRKSLPPITKLDKKASQGRSTHGMKVNSAAKLTRDDRSSKDVRVWSVTPVQAKPPEEKKSPGKKTSKSPTPAVRKAKPAPAKKHSMS